MVPDLPGAKLATGVKDQLITLSGSLYPITLFVVTSLTEVEGIVAGLMLTVLTGVDLGFCGSIFVQAESL